MRLLAIIASLSVAAAAAHAQPAEAPPDNQVVCGARAPVVGQTFDGPVLHVLDGRTVCVAQGPTPQEWVRVTLADTAVSTPRSAALAALFSRTLTCTTTSVERRGVTARCALGGASAGGLIRSNATRASSSVWR